jgi:hypothetical protein
MKPFGKVQKTKKQKKMLENKCTTYNDIAFSCDFIFSSFRVSKCIVFMPWFLSSGNGRQHFIIAN